MPADERYLSTSRGVGNVRELLALLLLIAAGGCEAMPPYDAVHGATLGLVMPKWSCSGWVPKTERRNIIGTAAHCIDETVTSFTANGKTCQIAKVIRDKTDHVFVRVTGCRLPRGVEFGPAPRVGDKVFLWSSPFVFKDLLIFGSVAGYTDGELIKAQTTLYDLNAWAGSSGGAIFNQFGQVIGVLSIGTFPYRLMGSFPFTFTRAQLREAGL